MPVKRYGIYLAYPPTIDLRADGLGRLLAEFLKGSQKHEGLQFSIACPSWMRDSLEELLESAGVPRDRFEIIAPPRQPFLLRAHHWLLARREKKRAAGILVRFAERLRARTRKLELAAQKRAVNVRSPLQIAALAGVLATWLVAATAFVLLRGAARAIAACLRAVSRPPRQLLRMIWPGGAVRQIRGLVLSASPKNDPLTVRLYRHMEEGESEVLRQLIEQRSDIQAWYCPTAFWPQFNDIDRPRLTCIPDVVLAHFPAGYAQVGGERFLENFRQVEKSIERSQYFVTYSEDVKWRTLVERYRVEPSHVTVIRHGANRLDELITASGFPDNAKATENLCRTLLNQAMAKAVLPEERLWHAPFDHADYLFYASQFRPSKNVISLLRAYEYLLRRRHIGHKLVLTGYSDALPEIADFILEHRLEFDVLCLHKLSARELAACYRLAALAVNPSLSEGGCPFTLTEALSVGTPVVMARIAVTEEVVVDADLRGLMLFDPYDWRDMAARIEWALANRETLLAAQLPFYRKLAQRGWPQVVDEYIGVLDHIAQAGRERSAAGDAIHG